MIRQLLNKWFGLEDKVCETCEVLRQQLDESNRERRELLHKLIDPPKAEPPTEKEEEFTPIKPQFIPWRVRQQLLEAEDRKKAQLMKDRTAELEKELGVAEDVSAPSGGVKFK